MALARKNLESKSKPGTLGRVYCFSVLCFVCVARGGHVEHVKYPASVKLRDSRQNSAVERRMGSESSESFS